MNQPDVCGHSRSLTSQIFVSFVASKCAYPPLPSPTCPPFRIGRSRLGTLLFNRSNKNEFNTTRTNHVIPVKSFDMVLTLLIQSFVFLMHSRNTLFVRKSCERLERMVQTVVKPYKDRKCKCKTQERYTSFF